MRNIKRLMVTASALALAVAGVAAPAQAAPAGNVLAGVAVPGGFSSWTELLTVQERMNAAGARITALAHADAASGYAGLVADPTTRELRVYWKGKAPAGVTSLASRAAVPIRVLPAAYSEKELRVATTRLLAAAGDKLTAVGPKADGSGLTAGTAGETIPASTYAGVPVALDTNLALEASTRLNDAPPWSGGSRWVNVQRNSSCTTGFAIRQAGVNRLLTAAHCAANNQTANDGAGQLIGTYGSDVNANDVGVINGNAQARVFNNTTNAAGGVVSEFTNNVVNGQASAVGNFVCSSGSFSGTRCRIQVASINQCINLTTVSEGTVQVCGQVRANQIDGTNAGGQGDSGGPVITTVAGDATRVIARGTVSARPGGLIVPCTGYVPNNRECSSGLFYEDISPGLAAVGASLLVTP